MSRDDRIELLMKLYPAIRPHVEEMERRIAAARETLDPDEYRDYILYSLALFQEWQPEPREDN